MCLKEQSHLATFAISFRQDSPLSFFDCCLFWYCLIVACFGLCSTDKEFLSSIELQIPEWSNCPHQRPVVSPSFQGIRGGNGGFGSPREQILACVFSIPGFPWANPLLLPYLPPQLGSSRRPLHGVCIRSARKSSWKGQHRIQGLSGNDGNRPSSP